MVPHAGAKGILKTVGTGTGSLLLAFLLMDVLVQPFRIEGGSMAPTLNNNDYVLLDRILLRGGSLKRGEIAVFRDRGSGHYLVKRVAGLPGETIEIKAGRLFINGKAVSVAGLHLGDSNLSPIKIPSNEYFFIGDNGPCSRDSRSFGPVSREQIYGRVLLRYLPLNKMVWLDRAGNTGGTTLMAGTVEEDGQ